MKLIDDQILHRDWFISFKPPVKVVLYNACAIAVLRIVRASPLTLPRDGTGIRVKEDLCLVETESFLFIIRPVQPVGVFELFDIKSEYDHGIDKTDLIIIRKFQCGERLFRIAME